MALIKCPECGKEISDTIRKCPNCGYRKKTKPDKKIFIIGGAIVALALIIGVVLMLFTREKPLTVLEQQAVDCITNYKAMLKNPNSLQVHKIRWEKNKFVEDMIFIYIDVSGQNGFGGNNRHIIRYGIKKNDIEFPPFVWYMINEPRFTNSGESSVLQNTQRRWIKHLFDNDKEKALKAVVFSDGGVYNAGDLHTRAEMFDQMQSVIHSLNQNLNFFIQEVNILMLKK